MLVSQEATSEDSGIDGRCNLRKTPYLQTLSYFERLQRLLMDIVKDNFEYLGHSSLNPVQAMLIFNIDNYELSAGDLKNLGYYQGTNVSYNLKKLVDAGYVHHRRSDADRRSVRVSLTDKGKHVRNLVSDLFDLHWNELSEQNILSLSELVELNRKMNKIEQYWVSKIRYIY